MKSIAGGVRATVLPARSSGGAFKNAGEVSVTTSLPPGERGVRQRVLRVAADATEALPGLVTSLWRVLWREASGLDETAIPS
jgi:hypothetical protein